MVESTDAIREFASPPGDADSQVHESRPGSRTVVAHQPYVPDKASIPEFTLQAVLAGALLGIVFGASSLYLVLRVGLTVSASIPVAVLSITLFRAFSKIFGFRPATILENNITQTAGSAGESIAFGVGVTMPALMLLGFEMDFVRVLVVSVLGGLLGILMMIPLRRAFIVNMHGKPGQPDTLLYPEGTACAEVLISGEKGGTSGKTVFIGFGIAFLLKFIIDGMTLLRLTVNIPLKFFNRVAVVATDMAPELLGVGYVIGVRIASVMMAGAVIGNLVIVPAIATFGDQVTTAIAPGTKPIGAMDLGDIQKNYLRFIGAGCVTAAGIISMMRTLPLVIRSFGSSLGSLRGGAGGANRISRTDRDLSGKAVLFGSAGLLALLAVFLVRELSAAGVSDALIKGVLGAGLVLIFGFLFVTVSSRLTGEIGSSSNPISGMTVATLALTCLIFLTLHMTSPVESVVALSIGGVVCIAASNGGTTSQDLKTGYLVGATPIYQQWAILIGAISSALVIGYILLVFNQAGTVYSKKDLPNVTLSAADYDALTDREIFEGKEFRVWRPQDVKDVLPGKYLIDESRKPAVLVDPAITGRLKKRDDDSDVKMKFPAPKTQVIGIIINGVLQQKLNWGLILIGAMLSIGLELCGVGSLAFAVGVYIPMQYTTPIFLGGLVRYAVERLTAKPAAPTQDEATAIAESETGPGVLLSSGYIAGGTLAGVLIAFLELPFFEKIKTNFIDFALHPTPGAEGEPYFTLSAGGFDFASLIVFAVLMTILLLVGSGKLLRQSPEAPDQEIET
ncbi:MAG TPA: oligopeptide transporter, OPT family [Planctomycetaceae bacterium]|jgi:putative OPT family oligopeptide transporter|nr:oligopeptide transporter, OPT family [Planctomycetaceae bacterium]